MSYLSQMCSLTVQQFVTPAVGIGAALVIIRGFSKKGSPTVGNFWVDVTRALLYVLTPIAIIGGLIFVGQGAVDTLGGPVNIHNSLNGVSQTIAARSGRVHGGHQAAGHQRRRVLQHQLGPSLREPDGPDQPALHLPAAVHPGRPDLRLRQDGGGPAPGRGRPGRHVHHLRCLGRHLGGLGAPGQPRRAGRRPHPPANREHHGQGGPIRRPELGALRCGVDLDVHRIGQLRLRLLHPDRRRHEPHRHDARRSDSRRRGQRDVHHLDLRHHRGLHRRADGGPNARVSREEDPGHGGEAGRPGDACDADHRAGRHGAGRRRSTPGRSRPRTAVRTASPRSSTP